MPSSVDIRRERESDVDGIASVTEQAFRSNAYSQGTEQYIIEALRKSGALCISLVAQIDGRVVGHIAFSPVRISDGSPRWYGLGPLAVAPAFQKRGIGTALVKAGLEELQRLDAQGCVLVGEPGYYERFGFRSDPRCTMEGVPQEFVLSLPFGNCPQAVGRITHHEAFHARGPQQG